MSEKFFLGGVTPNGFTTQLGELVTAPDYYTYILKGGAGTGKSSLMKKIADRFENSENVTRYYCSSDPDSLDAVVLHSSKVVVVDGTAPHVFDPKYPGACQKVVNLGYYWNDTMLKDKKEEIIKTTDDNKHLLSCAAGYAAALGKICSNSMDWGEKTVDYPKLEAFSQRFCRKLFGKKRGLRGRQSIRQLSVLTMYGYMTLSETLENYLDIYSLSDDRFFASDRFIRLVAEQALKYGYDVKLSPCLVFDKQVYQHLLIDEIGVAIISADPLTKLSLKNSRRINMLRFYSPKSSSYAKKYLRINAALTDQLSELASDTMAQAKQIHDTLESFYIKTMDFEGIDRVCESISKEISLKGGR